MLIVTKILKINKNAINPLVPGMRNIQIRQYIIVCLLIVCLVKMLFYLEDHYSERQGLMG